MRSPRETNARLLARRGGFTLTEILIALGLLGVGMAMVAALLVTGVSVIDMRMHAGMVAANGLATAQRKIRASDVTVYTLTRLAYHGKTNLISANEQRSPENDTSSRDGFIVLGREFDGDSNTNTKEAYQLVIIAYHKTADTNVRVEPISGSVAGNILTVTAGLANMRVGTPVIVQATGEWATVISIDGSAATLDHTIDSLAAVGNAWVVYQDGSAETDTSPATFVLVNRSSLAP